MHLRTQLLFASLLGACTDKGNDSGSELCPLSGEPSLTIGYGVGDQFTAYETGAEVGLESAPQGGWGVGVRARTTGIAASAGSTPHATSAVLLDTYLDGDLAGSFLNETVEVYCQDDGTGLIWGVVVGFDPVTFDTNEALLNLHGEEVELWVEATDAEGRVATGIVDVIITVGR
jgi:hypothetical protein